MTAPTPTVDATYLAQIAETADGTRDVELGLVITSNGPEFKVLGTGDVPVLKVLTPNRKPNRGRPAIKLGPPGRPNDAETIDNMAYDALFWSESAVEKFVFPYYAAQRVLPEGDLARFRTMYLNDEDAIAIIHTPPTRSFVVDKDSIHIVSRSDDGGPLPLGGVELGPGLVVQSLTDYLGS